MKFGKMPSILSMIDKLTISLLEEEYLRFMCPVFGEYYTLPRKSGIKVISMAIYFSS